MKTNMGTVDRIARTLIAATILVLFLTGNISGTLGIVLLVAGGVFLLTSFMGVCPLYNVLGISTCAVNKTHPKT